MSILRNQRMLHLFFTYCVINFKLCSSLELSNGELQKAMLALWSSDANRADDGQVVLDFQEHTTGGSRFDVAPKKLFKYVDPVLLRNPTYRALLAIFDALKTPSASFPSPSINAKVSSFLDKVETTGPYKTLRQILASRAYGPARNEGSFRKAISDLWFGNYARGTADESSGFEHVFIGEIKRGEIVGLHNWIRIYYLEQSGQLDYAGFIIKRPRIATIQFKIGDAWKRTGSVMVGSSPEFDIAVFTLCFLAKQGPNACQFFLGDCTAVDVTSYPFTVKNNVYIGTVFPSPGKTDAKCPVGGKKR